MIVWADEDNGQPGLHANFKLSAGGEAVVLSSPELVIIDSLTYGAQSTDISMGRCPEGTGAFDSMPPSAGAANICAAVACGDMDGSGVITIADVVFFINYMFAGGPTPNPISIADTDCDGTPTISDVVFLVNYFFAGGPEPCAACL